MRRIVIDHPVSSTIVVSNAADVVINLASQCHIVINVPPVDAKPE